MTYANGTETDYGYNTLNRLTSVTNKVTSSGNILSSYTYTLNADGMRIGVAEQQKESDGSTSTTTKTWTYDNLMRLTVEAVTSSISANSYSDTYSYDLVGNRLSKTDLVGTTTTVTADSFNNNDQLTSETGTVNNVSSWSTSFQYDPNGSLTNVTRTSSGAETDGYVYDLQHRLSSATINHTEQGQSVAITASYVYDDSGYRAQGTVTVNNGTPTVTNYLTDTMNPTGYTQVLEEHIGNSSTPSMSYIIGLAVIAQTNSSGTTTYLMPDALGSTRLVVDPSGTITVRYQYDAYGNVLGVAVGVLSPPATEILYTGQFFVVATLQYYLRARMYMPMTARFTTMDPFKGDPNRPLTLERYSYAADNPVIYSDPSGREFVLSTFVWTSIKAGLVGMVLGGIYGGLRGGIDAALDPDASWSDVWYRAFRGMLLGAAMGGATGLLLPTVMLFGPYATLTSLGLLSAYGLWNDVDGVKESIKAGKYWQALERGGFAILDALLAVAAIRGAGSAADNAVNPPKNPDYAAGEGVVVPNYIVNTVTFLMRALNVNTARVPRELLLSSSPKGTRYGAFDTSGKTPWMFLAEDATWYEFLHEILHAIDWIGGGSPSKPAAEQFVYDMLQTFFWKFLSPAQKADAATQVASNGGVP